MAQIGNSRSMGKSSLQNSRKIATKQRPSKQTRPARKKGAQNSTKWVPPERRQPKQQRAQSTTSAIITAAEQLLVDVGYARASTNLIAQRAGVSIGSLYQYFSSKEEVYRAVVEKHSRDVKPEIHEALETLSNLNHDVVSTTLKLLSKMAQKNVQNPRLMLAIDRELGWLGHDKEARVELTVPVTAILKKRLNLPKQELEVISQLMIEVVSHLSRWLVHSKPVELDTDLFIAKIGDMLAALVKNRSKKPTVTRA
jgi:AcrR family transcriptional regulator